ncbi:MAG: response regulator, partial [Desulfuromonadales bacterium]|nr:response regulator [Desulfuromonadales bacterium]
MDKRFKILVVDDDAINVQLILATLKNEYDVFTALNGYAAIALLADHPIDLILLDVMMPDLDGFEVCSIIKAEERYADIPVIFLTALDTQDGALRGLDTGGIDYLTKPVNFDLLKLRVRNHLALKERNALVKEQRALLARQKKEYQTLFHEMLDAFALHEMIWDEEGKACDYRYLAVNPAFERITGLKEDAVIGRTVLELLPEIEPEWIETYGKVARTGETVLLENYSAALNKYFEVKAFRPAPNQFACMFVDITERKKIEEAQLFLLQAAYLGTGEDFFQSLARYLAQTFDMDFVCIDRLLGDNLVARTLAIYSDGEFVDNLDYSLHDTPCGEVLSKGLCIYSRDVRQRFPTDQILQELAAESYIGITLWDSAGKPVGLLAMIGRKPMEDQHLAESILKLVSLRAAAELERKLADEEKEVLQKQFQQAQKLESLGVLVGGVAHDFNNLLAMIMGSCFLGQSDPAAAGEHFSRIETAAQRGAELCRQMLAYAGKAQFSLEQVNMEVLIADLMQLVKALLHKNVTMTLDTGSDLPGVVGDNSRISQVVMNLVINAAEAIGDVPGEIRLRLKKISFSSAAPQKDHLGQKIP